MAWRVLLNYLPENRKTWSDYVHKQRCTYNQFVGKNIFIQDTGFYEYLGLCLISPIANPQFWLLYICDVLPPADEIIIQHQATNVNEDHPLNPNPNSQWQSFFKDNEVLLQVRLSITSWSLVYETIIYDGRGHFVLV